jgi:hypothetical protein
MAPGDELQTLCLIRESHQSKKRAIEEKRTDLHYPPILVIVKLDFCGLPQLPGFPPCHVPLSPINYLAKQGPLSWKIKCSLSTTGANTSLRIYGLQIARSNHVLVDIGKTTCFSLSPFNAYVALSRDLEAVDEKPSGYWEILMTTYSFVTHPKTYELKTNALTHLPKKAACTMQKENTVPNRRIASGPRHKDS